MVFRFIVASGWAARKNWWAIYLTIGVITFGHSYTHNKIYRRYVTTGEPRKTDVPLTTMAAVAAGVGWPLYLSTYVAEAVWPNAAPAELPAEEK